MIDWSKYCTRRELRRHRRGNGGGRAGHQARRAQRLPAAVRAGWSGPRPSTHVSCTIGGMIGNNSCGSTAQAYGKMVDSVRRTGGAHLRRLGCGSARPTTTSSQRIVAEVAGAPTSTAACRPSSTIRATISAARYPDIPRRVSGYNLDSAAAGERLSSRAGACRQRKHLGDRAAGRSSAWCAYRRQRPGGAGLRRHRRRRRRGARGARHRPAALEGLDHRLVALEHAEHLADKALRQLPDGSAWLMVAVRRRRPRTKPTRSARHDRRPARGDTARHRDR